ncbi:MAG: hydrolase [Betaproteobacteria bacterium]|nr:hydrolase [Betaproteobacteria bacterium]
MLRIVRQRSFLLVVDVHVKLAPAMFSREQALANISVLIRAARRLEVPLLISEHYRRGLGPTVPEIAALAPKDAIMEKIHFSCADEPACAARMAALERPQAVICGMEAHVCVMQTALGLKDAGYQPFVVNDATSSRRPESHATAMERVRQAGIPVVTTEMTVFEWLNRGDSPEFRELLPLVK